MADEDKLVNVVVKYSQQGAEQVAKDSAMMGKSADDFYAKQSDTWDTLGKEFKAYQGEYGKGASTIISQTDAMKNAIIAQGKAEAEAFRQMTKGMDPAMAGLGNQIASQIEAKAAAEAAALKPAAEMGPGAPGGPLDPSIPKRFNQELRETERGYQSLINAGNSLSQISNSLLVSGALMSGALTLSGTNYVKTVGSINEQNAKWLGYEEDIKDANLEIGKVAAQAMLPTMKMTAELMQKVADIANANPWLVQGVMTAGSIMVAVGGAMKVAAEIMKVTGEVGRLIVKAQEMIAQATMAKMNAMGGVGSAEYLPGGAGAAGAASIGTMAAVAGTIIAGIIAGAAIYNKIKPEGRDDAGTIAAKAAALSVTGLAHAAEVLGLASEGAEARTFQWMTSILGLNKAQEAAAAQAEIITEQETQTYIAFQKQTAEATKNYGEQRKTAVEEYEKQVVEATKRYEEQRRDVIESFNKQMIRSAQDFTRSQNRAQEGFDRQIANVQESSRAEEAQAAKEFRNASKKAAQAHALDMQRMEQQHNNRLGDLAAARDALGIVKENQAYALSRSQKDQDFRLSEQERRADFQRQQAENRANAIARLAEMRADFERQRAEQDEDRKIQIDRQKADQKERLAKMEADHKAEMKKLEEQEKEKAVKQKEAYDKQISQIQSAFVDRLRALDKSILGDTDAFQKHLQDQSVAFQKWLADFKAQQVSGQVANVPLVVRTGPGRQYGGYATFNGPGETGRPEFVMSGDSTQMAESLLGARLNQTNLMSGLMAARNGLGGPSGRNMQITVTSRSLSISEIRSEINGALNQKLGDLIPAFGV